MAAKLRGYQPIVVQRVSKRTGKPYHYTQGYVTPRGKRISRREYDDRRIIRESSFSSRGDLERFRLQVSGDPWLSDIYKHSGRAPTFSDYDAWREVRDRRAVLKAQYPHLDRGRRDAMDRELVTPDGPLARILDATGRRPMRPGVAVGES